MGLGKTIQVVAFLAALRVSKLRDIGFPYVGLGRSVRDQSLHSIEDSPYLVCALGGGGQMEEEGAPSNMGTPVDHSIYIQ